MPVYKMTLYKNARLQNDPLQKCASTKMRIYKMTLYKMTLYKNARLQNDPLQKCPSTKVPIYKKEIYQNTHLPKCASTKVRIYKSAHLLKCASTKKHLQKCPLQYVHLHYVPVPGVIYTIHIYLINL